MNEDKWWCRIDEEIVGPLPWTDVVALAQSGRLKSSDLVKKAGRTWFRADGVQWASFGVEVGQGNASLKGQTEQPGPRLGDSGIQVLLHRLAAGEDAARQELISRSLDRLERLVRRMLRENPAVHRWEQTGDVLQNALLRLDRALRTQTPESPRRFIGLAATQIRRELIDLYRHYYGPEGSGSHHDTAPDFDAPGATLDPLERLMLHEAVERLPTTVREVFEMRTYGGMKQDEIAEATGVSTKTVKRRWRNAQRQLKRDLGGANDATKPDWRAGI